MSAEDEGGGSSAMTPGVIGGMVVGVSLAAAAILCTGLCLALWYKRLRGDAGDPSPATFLVSKRKPDQYASPDHPMAFVMPTITASEAGSEPQTPTPTQILTPTERSKGITKSVGSASSTISHSRSNPANPEDHPNVQRWDAITTSRTPPPAYSPPPICRSQGYGVSPPSFSTLYSNIRPRSASPKGPLNTSRQNPPLSLPIPGNRWTPRAVKRPRSASPRVLQPSPVTPPALPPRPFQVMCSRTPPTLPPRSIFLRRSVGGSDEARNSHQSHYLLAEEAQRSSPDLADVTTPDSIDGWGPTWTPASSIASGGGCGLGELRIRLRYSMRTRLLRLTVLSADNLPLRLGPEPVDTYTKAVLLPDKRVRFSTRAVPALRNAHFNASFTHAARPTRLAHTALRFSVCQVTGCGRRVVLGYAALSLSSTGLRAGLNHDLDTGSLTLHLQESAPDQQICVGGQLQIGLSWNSDAHELSISILHLTGLQGDRNTISQDVQVYIKVTVYTNNTILCWRRTTPRTMEAEVTLFEEELILRMPELDLDATHLVLSARERTGPGCGRKVLGSCVVGRGSCVGEEGRHHWLDMLRAAPDIVVRTHPLTALEAFQTQCLQQNPPPYQSAFPSPSRDSDLPIYHRYQNIGLISNQNFPVVEIPGPERSQSQEETSQKQSQEQDSQSSSDEGQSSEVLTPEQCQSPEPATDDGQDTEVSSVNESHHSELMSSDQSHYSEISTPEQLSHDQSTGSQSLIALDKNNETSVDCEKEGNVQPGENIYYNVPLNQHTSCSEAKVSNEPVYAKPDMTLKRSYRKASSCTSDSVAVGQSSFEGSYRTSEPIYDSPDLIAHRIHDKAGLQEKHVYSKPVTPLQHLYENSSIISGNVYQVPDLTVSHIYQTPDIFSHHVYESPVSSPEHIYQMPYESSLRRYQNINLYRQPDDREYANLAMLDGSGKSKRRYENVPGDYEVPDTKRISTGEVSASQRTSTVGSISGQNDTQLSVKHYRDSIEEEQAEFYSLQYEENIPPQDYRSSMGDNISDTSEIYHDARSSTKSE
ncbi:uncharacterized protein LOC135211864 isoform X1 [Macrobrachium nipponense]|uniref:uncharacterized protein LOC135211864 isoform X1 n=1 Tax=Macrobrachium nipponense TaxID=159736 RepID=UPI0030C864CE